MEECAKALRWPVETEPLARSVRIDLFLERSVYDGPDPAFMLVQQSFVAVARDQHGSRDQPRRSRLQIVSVAVIGQIAVGIGDGFARKLR